MINTLDITYLGQVFTPLRIVHQMLALVKNQGCFLEPSCGNGAFFKLLPQPKTGVEIDPNVITDAAVRNEDFFALDTAHTFDTIIGNPPYVRYQDIAAGTKKLLTPYEPIFDNRSNLYLFFIYKCIVHLKDKGELIFITPRDFLKSTAAIKLNQFIFDKGSITDLIDLGDKKIFERAQPNCIIWRFEKGNFVRRLRDGRQFSCVQGQLLFTKKHYFIPFKALFCVKVGAVSGADGIFSHDILGNQEFVSAATIRTGRCKRMIYGDYGRTCAYLQGFKEVLKKRKVRAFDDSNWWKWGRTYYKSALPRIYVNTKTRQKQPFFYMTVRLMTVLF